MAESTVVVKVETAILFIVTHDGLGSSKGYLPKPNRVQLGSEDKPLCSLPIFYLSSIPPLDAHSSSSKHCYTIKTSTSSIRE